MCRFFFLPLFWCLSTFMKKIRSWPKSIRYGIRLKSALNGIDSDQSLFSERNQLFIFMRIIKDWNETSFIQWSSTNGISNKNRTVSHFKALKYSMSFYAFQSTSSYRDKSVSSLPPRVPITRTYAFSMITWLASLLHMYVYIYTN